MDVKVKIQNASEFTIERDGYAVIDPAECVNCGLCREYCPSGAISEMQREVCRICPGCADKSGLTFEEMRDLSENHACTISCPVGISPQGYINLLKEGKNEAAYKLIWDKTPFPAVLGYVCHHPCEDDCKRGLILDEPLKIRALKRYITNNTTLPEMEKYPVYYEETIAIIGAGPAGLSAAHDLAKNGYQVTVFDSAKEAGGMLLRGIPRFRLPREIVESEIAALERGGIKFSLGRFIGPNQIEKLLEEFDIVLIATGTPKSKVLDIEGWNLEGIFNAVDYMDRINNDSDIWRHPGQEFIEHGEVVVIGGGSVGIDAARAALRDGASKVTVICMECGDAIPAHAWEIEEAKDEGIEIMGGWSPVRFMGEYPKLNAIELLQVDSVVVENGKFECTTIAGTEKTIKADMIIEAIGQKSDDIWNEYKGHDKVFFAGDIQSSNVSVVHAMASGKSAALDIDGALQGGKLKDPLDLRILHRAPIEEKLYPATRQKDKNYPTPLLSVEERIKDTKTLVELDLSDEAAMAEVNRCLACGYQYVDPDKCIGCGICIKVCPKNNVIRIVRDNKEAKIK